MKRKLNCGVFQTILPHDHNGYAENKDLHKSHGNPALIPESGRAADFFNFKESYLLLVNLRSLHKQQITNY